MDRHQSEDRPLALETLAVSAGYDCAAALFGATEKIDLAPFLAVARLLYDGPWVAERYAATKRLIESRPDSLLPVTRKIIEDHRGRVEIGTPAKGAGVVRITLPLSDQN